MNDSAPHAPARPKQLTRVLKTSAQHWVGDGFPVRSLFSYPDTGAELSPFLLLDHAGPHSFEPTSERRGVGAHPHRGFETVTIVYAGQVDHRDSSGAQGSIGPGDVQWMTAGAGVVHEEFHGREFARAGGAFEMVQLWVNLPAKHKQTPARYQQILASQIPSVRLGLAQGSARVIAGDFEGASGPALTFTELCVVDLELDTESSLDLDLPNGWTTALVVLDGALEVGGVDELHAGSVAIFDRGGDAVRIDRARKAKALLLGGEPIDEPIVGSGPFVMNTAQQIRQAVLDYHSGAMG